MTIVNSERTLSIGKKIAYSTIIWITLFLVCELGVRTVILLRRTNKNNRYTYNPSSLFVPHPFFAYAANPNHNDITPQGFRGRKETVFFSPKDSSIRIACLGGSSTYGTRVFYQDSYPAQLQEQLSKRTGANIEIINGGLGGYSTANIIPLLSLKIIHFKPKIVLFYVGFNDIWNRVYYPNFQTDYSHAQKSWELPGLPWWRHSELLHKIANRLGYVYLKDPHIHYVAWHHRSGIPEENWRNSTSEVFRANLVTLVAISRFHGSVPILISEATDFENHPINDNELWRHGMSEHDAILNEVAKSLSVDVIDVRSVISNKIDYFADVLHMNESGNKECARIIASYLIDHRLVEIKSE